MRIALLGPVRVMGDEGTPADIGGARLRMLVARLALDAGRVVPADALIDGLWGAEPPADAANALQSLVSRLRKVLPWPVESGSGGYRLAVGAADVDVNRFERLAADGRRELGAGRDAYAAELLTEALALWRGTALGDVLDAPFAQAPAARLEELRAEALEDRFEADIRLGRHADVLADLTAANEAAPLRERLAGLRIRALCAAGRQSDALAVYDAVRRTLADQLGVDPSAELREIHLAALRGEFVPPAPAADRLPTRLTSFVGRGDELKMLAELLAGSRLVTLVGPGGAGKTRLATEAASQHPAHRQGRVWFVPLAGVRDPNDILGALIGALGIRELRSTDEVRRRPMVVLLEQAVEALGGGEVLLVLDNCEHVVDASARLAEDLLQRLPGLRLLATSREPLAITGEAICPLGPLPVPGERVSAAEAAELDSTRLFLDRAVAVRPDFVLDESTVDEVSQICRRLDGMPLALELAAARLRSMTVGQIAGRLDDRFRLLTSGSRTALPRQRTLRAVVEWSWDLLTDAELVLARRLAVFAAGVGLDAVEQVCADESLPASDVPYVLGSLVEKSIVDARLDARGELRYGMLETLRAYAGERLAESGERETLRSAMLRYYVTYAEELEPRLRAADQLDAIAAFEVENDNLVAALRAAIEASEVDTASRLLGGLSSYMMILGQHERIGEFLRQVRAFGDRLSPEVAAVLHVFDLLLNTLAAGLAPIDDVAEMIEECLRTGALQGYPMLAIALPMMALLGGRRDLGVEVARRAQESDDAWTRAAASWSESFLCLDQGDLAGSEAARERAAAGFTEIGDRWGLAMTLSFKAVTRSENGDPEAAIEAHQQGLQLAMELRAQDDIAGHWSRLAAERARAGDLPGAWRDIEAAERYVRDLGLPQMTFIVLFGRTEVQLRAGDIAGLRATLAECRRLSVRTPFGTMGDEWVDAYEARAALFEGKPDAAEPSAIRSLRSAARRGDTPDVAGILEILARVRWGQGRPEAAVRLLGLVVVIRGRLDMGNPDVRRLIDDLRTALPDRYDELFESTRSLSKEDAMAASFAEVGIDDPRA